MNFNILESYAMSNSDIFKVIGKSSVIKYPQFGSMSHIDECFDSQGRCVIFFETVSNQVGHWECLYKDGTTINFFDSYGIGPDVARKYLSKPTQINLMVKEVLKDMVKNGEVDITSRYESLNKNNIIGDFKVVLSEKFLSNDSDLTFFEKVVMNTYFIIKKFSLSEEKGFGLDSSSVKIEQFPLVLHAPENIEMHRIKGDRTI